MAGHGLFSASVSGALERLTAWPCVGLEVGNVVGKTTTDAHPQRGIARVAGRGSGTIAHPSI